MLIRDSLRRLLQLQIGILIPDFVTGRGTFGQLLGRLGTSGRAKQRFGGDSRRKREEGWLYSGAMSVCEFFDVFEL